MTKLPTLTVSTNYHIMLKGNRYGKIHFATRKYPHRPIQSCPSNWQLTHEQDSELYCSLKIHILTDMTALLNDCFHCGECQGLAPQMGEPLWEGGWCSSFSSLCGEAREIPGEVDAPVVAPPLVGHQRQLDRVRATCQHLYKKARSKDLQKWKFFYNY